MQGLDGDTSVSVDARPDNRAVGHRHALLQDFTLTEPFGILNAAAGIIGLFFKVQGCSDCLFAVRIMLRVLPSVLSSRLQQAPSDVHSTGRVCLL